MPANIDTLLKRYSQAFENTERQNSTQRWADIMNYIVPHQAGLFNGGVASGVLWTPGEKKTSKIYDSVGIVSNRDLAASINFTVTNPSTKWARYQFTGDPQLQNDRESKNWLKQVEDLVQKSLNDSNFDTAVSSNYEMFTALGNMILMQEDMGLDEFNRWRGFKFIPLHLAKVAFSENADGIVDTFYVQFPMTLRQAMEKWPETLPEELKKRAEQKPDSEELFVLAIYPRDAKDVNYDSQGKAFPEERPVAGIYFHPKNKTILEETGYYENPAFATRWTTIPGEVYGRGPGEQALPDIRSINTEVKTILQAAHIATFPPLFARDHSIVADINLTPATINFMRGNPAQDLWQYVPKTEPNLALLTVERLQENIQKAFFIDKLLLPPRTETGEMSAFEVSERLNQMNRVIGPVNGRLNREFLKPILLRSFNIMLRRGQLPEMPALVRDRWEQGGFDLDIIFINQMARSQQMEDITNSRTLAQLVAEMAQVRPEVVDTINVDEIVKKAAEALGVSSFALNDDKAIKQIRDAREKQVQAARMQEAAVTAADVASKTGGGNQGGQ